MRKIFAILALLAAAGSASADVYVSDADSMAAATKVQAHPNPSGAQAAKRTHVLKSGEKLHRGVPLSEVTPNATGSVQLVDSGGLKYFINTNITFSTSSSASGAMSEASYTAPVLATTSAGGFTTSTLNDAFDGYDAICVSLSNAGGPCQTGNASYAFYNQNGPASVDATVPATPECTNRQYVFPAKTIGGLSVQRKVYVPTNDQYSRALNSFTNTTGAPITFTMITSNNLGSDSNTRIVSTSSGDNVATTADNWVTTFQNYSGNTSSDPRIGHVLWGAGAATPISNINFVDGDDNPYWVYSITLNPGQTKAILNFVTGQPTKAAANAKAAELSLLPASAQQCLSATELGQVTNFGTNADLSISKTAPSSVNAGSNFAYTLNITNLGPSTATSVSVGDTLPPGLAFVNASGTGWTCGFAAGTVTCTQPSLALGSANPITINVTAPNGVSSLSNTATVSTASLDTTPGNNSSTASTDVVSPALVSGTKSVAGGTALGSSGTYTIVLTNSGAGAQLDNPGNEFVDVLPANLTLVSASATSGTAVATVGTNTVTWNGSTAAGGSVTITVDFTISSGALGTPVSNQGTLNFDADGNGTNESTAQTDDPGMPGAADPTVFTITFGAASKLVFTTQPPALSIVGGAFSANVSIEDANDNVVTTDTSNVTVALTVPNGATLGGTTTIAAVNGVATFSNLTVNAPGTYTLTASDGTLPPAQSNTFTIAEPAPTIVDLPSLGRIALALMLALLTVVGLMRLNGKRD
jgi:uncharacterized repeat protein (TIGR01451 family)